MVSLDKQVSFDSVLSKGRYLSDGIRTIDYVIVVEEEKLNNLIIYLEKLEFKGLEFEIAKGAVSIIYEKS